uniref:N-acyl-aromatic-L-amino acid amidohydrolase n=1 Tax=Terrapene triunguis TaxID=2587831 RepID=A0A674JT25_9SAUR
LCSSPSNRSRPLSRVAVSGGTHGNEMSGIYLAKHWLRNPMELRRGSFAVTPFLGNPRAIEKCVRYVGRDLNRTFTTEFLSSAEAEDKPYEVVRAREINQTYGPKGSAQAFDFMFDLHNTTANMGACLIVDSEESLLPMHMCEALLQYKYFEGVTFLSSHSGGRQGSLPMQCPPILSPLCPIGTVFPAFEIEAYKITGRMDYPRYPDGEISAMVHPKLQDKDFLPMNPGDPIFQTFSGEEILYEGDTTIYPAFINEAAYYEKKVAFAKMEKHILFNSLKILLHPLPAPRMD